MSTWYDSHQRIYNLDKVIFIQRKGDCEIDLSFTQFDFATLSFSSKEERDMEYNHIREKLGFKKNG